MQPSNEVFRRIEDVGPVICERGHWSVVVKTRDVQPDPFLIWKADPHPNTLETFRLAIDTLPSLFVGAVGNARWQLIGRRKSWREHGLIIPDLGEADYDRHSDEFVYSLPNNVLLRVRPLVLMQALFFRSSVLCRMGIEPGRWQRFVSCGYIDGKAHIVIEAGSGFKASSLQQPGIRATLALIGFSPEVKRAFQSIRFIPSEGSIGGRLYFDPPNLSHVIVDAEGLLKHSAPVQFFAQQFTRLALSGADTSTLPKKVEVLFGDKAAENGQSPGGSTGKQKKYPLAGQEAVIDIGRRPKGNSSPVKLSSGGTSCLSGIPDVRFNITGTAERKSSGAHGYPGKGTDDVSVGIGADPWQSSARTADYQEEPNSEESLRGSNLHAIAILQDKLVQKHPTWNLHRSVLAFRFWPQGRARLNLLKDSGLPRRIAFLEVSTGNQTVTIIEIENTDLIRNLSLQIIEGSLNPDEKTGLTDEILLSSLRWNFDVFKQRHPVILSIKHKINEREESWINRIEQHLINLLVSYLGCLNKKNKRV